MFTYAKVECGLLYPIKHRNHDAVRKYKNYQILKNMSHIHKQSTIK